MFNRLTAETGGRDNSSHRSSATHVASRACNDLGMLCVYFHEGCVVARP
jgi:hypothetical protein